MGAVASAPRDPPPGLIGDGPLGDGPLRDGPPRRASPFALARPTATRVARVGLAVVLALAALTTFRGLDYSEHWDEHIVFQTAKRQVQTGVFLPGRYNYPSFVFYAPFVVLAPELGRVLTAGPSQKELERALVPVIESHAFKLRLRGALAALGLTTIVSAYLLGTALRRRELEGLVAAAFVGGSWELLYHARWVAPDVPQLAFATASMAALAWAVRRDDEGHDPGALRVVGAALAGLATSTKFPAGMLLAPLVATPFLSRRAGSRLTQFRAAGGLALVFALAYLFVTPATVLAPFEFFGQLTANARVYAVEGHGQYTITPGWPHLVRTLEYVALVVPARAPAASALVSLAFVVGAASLVRASPTRAAWLLFVPLFDVWWVSGLRVMIVRNVLFMAPFMFVVAAWGVGALADAIAALGASRPRLAHTALGALTAAVLLLFATNTRWAASAADSIRAAPHVDPPRALAHWLARRPAERFVVSPRVARELRAIDAGGALPPNVDAEPRWVRTSSGASPALDRAQRAIWMQHEPPNFMWRVPVNRRGAYELLPSGPYEANMDWYASWYSQDRVVITSITTATTAGITWPRGRTSTTAAGR
jgi:hypothetical protein